MTEKTVYSFDVNSGIYTGPVILNDSDRSPLEPSKFLIPGNCIEQLPPVISGSEQIVAVNGEWTVQQKIDSQPTLDDLKKSLKSAIADKRYAVESGGITVNGIAVETSLESQNRITSVIANAAAAGVTSVDFKAASGWVTLTIEQVQAIAAAIGQHVQACYTAERAHDTAIDALETVEAAQAYDVTTGWPS